MGHVFISYSSRDQDFVDRIIPAFEAAGIRVCNDRMGARSEDLWQRETVEAIETADAILIFLTSTALASGKILKVASLAKEAGNACILAIVLENTALPDEWRRLLSGDRMDPLF